MIKLKLLFNVKHFILILIIQLMIVLLYVNTLSADIDNLILNKNATKYELDFSRISIYDTMGIIDDEQVFDSIIDGLEDGGAEIFYFSYEQKYSVEFGENTDVILLDKNLADELIKDGMLKKGDEKGTIISSQKKNNSYAMCQEIVLYDIYNCEDTAIEVNDSDYVRSSLTDYFSGDYGSAIMMGVIIRYDGDLSALFDKILAKNNLDLNYNVSALTKEIEHNYEKSSGLLQVNRQNIISFGLIWILTITLSTLLYLTSMQRTISILILLGYSKSKILFNMIFMNLLSIVLPYFILRFNDIYTTNYYIITDAIIIILAIVIMFVIMQNSIKEKVRERI